MFCLLLVASALPVWALLLAVVVLLSLQLAPVIRRKRWQIQLKLFRLACLLPFDSLALLFAPSVSGAMGARGIYVAQETHVVNLIPPASYSATKTSGVINMKGWEHLSIILQVGSAGTPPTVTLQQSDNGSPANTTALPFNLHKCEVSAGSANSDVLSGRNAETSAGFAPAATNNEFYVLEFDASVLGVNYADEENYVQLVLTSPTSCFISAVAILSAGRYVHDQSETVLV